MNFIDNEYLVPVFIGDCKETRRIERLLRRATGIRGHFFAEEFSFLRKLASGRYTVSPMRDAFLIQSLLSFSALLEEYYCPVIVVCGEEDRQIVGRIACEIESSYVIIESDALLRQGGQASAS